MSIRKTEKKLETKFHVSWYIIAYKLVFGAVELVLGLGMIFFAHQALQIYNSFVAEELSEDPHDLLVHLSLQVVPNFLTHDTLLALYMLLLGAVKIAGSIGLIRRKNWGADLIVILIIILFPFQVIDLVQHPSVFSLIYTLTGIFIAFYLMEYKPRAWISRKFEYVKIRISG